MNKWGLPISTENGAPPSSVRPRVRILYSKIGYRQNKCKIERVLALIVHVIIRTPQLILQSPLPWPGRENRNNSVGLSDPSSVSSPTKDEVVYGLRRSHYGNNAFHTRLLFLRWRASKPQTLLRELDTRFSETVGSFCLVPFVSSINYGKDDELVHPSPRFDPVSM